MAGAKKTDEKNKNLNDMAKVFCLLPAIRELTFGVETEEDLIKKLQTEIYKDDKTGVSGYQAYKLVRYILATNRSTIRYLTDQNKIPFKVELGDMFDQYILTSQDPFKERKF